MTIITDIGNFGDWLSLKCEMEALEVDNVKVTEIQIYANTTRLGSIPGRLTIEEVRELAQAIIEKKKTL